MSDELTITFRFQKRLTPEQAKIIALAMAELIKLDPPDGNWQYTLDCPPEEAYALGVATAEFVGALAAHVNGNVTKPARQAVRRPTARRPSPKARAGRGRKTETESLSCPQCGRTFRHAKRLANHLSDVHGQPAAEGEGA